MALLDRPVVKRLVEEAQSRTGLTVTPAKAIERWRVMEREFGEFVNDAEELALHSMDYHAGRPSEMRHEQRRRLAQRSRIALLQDPLAGAEAELLSNFGFGKGVTKPSARNPQVQDVIDSAWTDPINEQLLCGYQAQRKLSNELLTAGELFVTLRTGGGKVRVGRLDADRVRTVIPDPENRNIPLWYAYIKPPVVQWDFDTDQADWAQALDGQGREIIQYWPHWRNVEDAVADRERLGTDDGEEPLVQPPAEKLGPGGVYHVAINQTGEQLRGNPPWARSLRFFTAMNVLTESHVAMAQAASAFVAKRSMTGGPKQIAKAAASVLTQAGELGAAAFRPAAGWGTAGNAEPPSQPFTPPGQSGGFAPGSWWSENQSSNLQALNLRSGAGEMAQTAQIVRAPIAASSGFGQHYLGDAQNGNLATAATLELPATMRVGAWQEYFEQMYRWFTDRAIEAAVKTGKLGGGQSLELGVKPLSELRLQEAEDRQEMESRTGKDLSYEFSMPFPGRRQLADVTTFVQTLAVTMDPNGVNVPYRRILLRFAFEQIGIDDVARAVEESIPEKGLPGGIGPQANPPGAFAGAAAGAAPGGAPGAGATGAAAGAGANDPAAGQQPYGAKSGTGDGALEGEWLPADARKQVDQMTGAAGSLFRELVADPAVAATLALNGHG